MQDSKYLCTCSLGLTEIAHCLRNYHFGLFFSTLHAGLAARCKIKTPPGTKMEILEKWAMRDIKRPFSPPGGTCLPSRGRIKHMQGQLSCF